MKRLTLLPIAALLLAAVSWSGALAQDAAPNPGDSAPPAVNQAPTNDAAPAQNEAPPSDSAAPPAQDNQAGATNTQSDAGTTSTAQDEAGNQATTTQTPDGQTISKARDSAGNEAVSGQAGDGPSTSAARDSAGNEAVSSNQDGDDQRTSEQRRLNQQMQDNQRRAQGQRGRDEESDASDDVGDLRRDQRQNTRTRRFTADDDVAVDLDDDSDRRDSSRVRAQIGNFGLSFSTEGDNDLRIGRVVRDGRAARWGFREGDTIVSINGRRITSRRDYDRWMGDVRPGSRVPFVIIRDGRERTVYTDWDDADYDENYVEEDYIEDRYEDRASLGVVLDSRYQQAAVVRRVLPGSPAEEAGLRAGDQIVAVDGQRIQSAEELTDLISDQQPGTNVEIEYTRRMRRATEATLGSTGQYSDSSNDVVDQTEWYRDSSAGSVRVRAQANDNDADEDREEGRGLFGRRRAE